MSVEHHRAAAARIIDEAVREPKLQHALGRWRVISGFAERVPGTKLHRRIVMWQAVDRIAQPVTPASRGGVDDGVEKDGVEKDGVEKDGVETDGVETDGVENDGVENDGVETDGVETDGVETDGVETDGVETDGVETDGVETIERIDFEPAGTAPYDRVADRIACSEAATEVAGWRTGSIDAIYIDPPFGTGVARLGRGHRYADRADDPDAFVAWLLPLLEEGQRVLAPHGSLFVHLDYRTVHYVKVALDRLFGRDLFVNELVWCYAVGGKSRRGFGRKHDTILWYARSADWAFYPDAVRVPRRGGSHMRVVLDGDRPVQEKTDRRTGRVYRYPVAAGKVPEDWWSDIETLNHSDRERIGWPSQKPERLVERIIHAVTRPGDRVADWFAGSGTTAAVAQRLGRGFMVCDRERAAVDLCVVRLAAQGRALAIAGTPPPPLEILRSSC